MNKSTIAPVPPQTKASRRATHRDGEITQNSDGTLTVWLSMETKHGLYALEKAKALGIPMGEYLLRLIQAHYDLHAATSPRP